MPVTEAPVTALVSGDFPAASHWGVKTLRAVGASWVIPLDRDPRESSRPCRQAASGTPVSSEERASLLSSWSHVTQGYFPGEKG